MNRQALQTLWLRSVLGLGLLPLLGTRASTMFVETDLVSNVLGLAAQFDPNLVNPWGLAYSATSPFWVADNGTGVSTLYDGVGVPQGLVVTVPPPGGGQPPSKPTGIVFNGGAGFEVEPAKAARFIFATEDGTISGWNPAANPTQAILKVDNSASGAIYKGLAIDGAQQNIYAANFHAGTIEAYSSSGFAPAALPGNFTDPALPAGFAPFNVQSLNGTLYVTYAKQDGAQEDDEAGPGNGYVNRFDLDGNFLGRLISQGPLNSPWGLAIAPSSFGTFAGDLLVGNFGDGRINAFDPITGVFSGSLEVSGGNPIEIPGLRALMPGNGGNGGLTGNIYFTAGINGEQDGLFGQLAPAVPEVSALRPVALGSAAVLALSLWRRSRTRRSNRVYLLSP